MKIALINTSPRLLIRKNDTCPVNTALQDARRVLRRHNIHDFEEYHVKTGALAPERLKALLACDVWLIVFPVYSAGLPSHVMTFMQAVEEAVRREAVREIPVYALGVTPLYDGREAYSAFQSLSLWCAACGFNWCGGIGAGGDMTHIGQKMEKVVIGRKRTYMRRLYLFAESIAEGRSCLNAGCTPDQRRSSFVIAFNKAVRRQARSNKLNNFGLREQP